MNLIVEHTETGPLAHQQTLARLESAVSSAKTFAMRDIKKAIPRRVSDMVRDGGRLRRLVVTVYPNGTIGLRPERTRREETVSAGGVWQRAVRDRVLSEKAAKAAARKARRA